MNEKVKVVMQGEAARFAAMSLEELAAIPSTLRTFCETVAECLAPEPITVAGMPVVEAEWVPEGSVGFLDGDGQLVGWTGDRPTEPEPHEVIMPGALQIPPEGVPVTLGFGGDVVGRAFADGDDGKISGTIDGVGFEGRL